KVLVRQPPAFGVQGFQQRHPLGVHLGSVRDVKLGQVDDIGAVGLERLYKGRLLQASGYSARLLLFLLAQEIERVLDVVMTGEGHMAVEFFEAVAMREAAHLFQRLRRLACGQEVEHTQALPSARRSVDPWYVTLITFGRLADSESPVVAALLKTPAMPDQ